VSILPHAWNKTFVIELGIGFVYPKQEERWVKYGEPLTKIFAPYFSGEKLFQWFKDESGECLAGLTVACFDSTSKWKTNQNYEKTLVLYFGLNSSINEFFIQFGTPAKLTGINEIRISAKEYTEGSVKAKMGNPGQHVTGFLPLVCDEPDESKPMNLIKKDEHYIVTYNGKTSNMARFRKLTKEQYLEISKSDELGTKE
jgi:hypothetical protein